MRVSDLPWEILEKICDFCTQSDVVNLAIACPHLADAVLPGVYRCIIIDVVPRSLDEPRPSKRVWLNGDCDTSVPYTSVHTIAGIKQCLAALAERPRYAAMVRSFSCRGNVALSDNDLLPRVRAALRNLTGLSEFEWVACPELRPDVLAELPTAATRLQALTVDLAIRPGQVYPKLHFRALRRLCVRPFLNADVLAWLHALVSESHGLEELELFRFLDSKREVGSSYAFVGLSDVYQEHDLVPVASSFFACSLNSGRECNASGLERQNGVQTVGSDLTGSIARTDASTTQSGPSTLTICGERRRWQLRKLGLSQTDTADTDVHFLQAALDVSQLEGLTLEGTGKEDEPNHGVLAWLMRSRAPLKVLQLDWCTPISGFERLLSSCCSGLTTLSLHVKEHPRQELDAVARLCPKLTRLTVHMDCMFELDDLRVLGSLCSLEVLQLPFTHAVNSWEIAPHIQQLRVLGLTLLSACHGLSSYGFASSRAPRANMGLLTSGIMDQWNDDVRPPLQCARVLNALNTHPALEYVEIDGQVTALKPGAPSIAVYYS